MFYLVSDLLFPRANRWNVNLKFKNATDPLVGGVLSVWSFYNIVFATLHIETAGVGIKV